MLHIFLASTVRYFLTLKTLTKLFWHDFLLFYCQYKKAFSHWLQNICQNAALIGGFLNITFIKASKNRLRIFYTKRQNLEKKKFSSDYSFNIRPRYKLPMPKSQQSWVRSQHPSTQRNLRGGRWSSVEYSTQRKKKSKNPSVYIYFPLELYNIHIISVKHTLLICAWSLSNIKIHLVQT
jgi:hypothetical protein